MINDRLETKVVQQLKTALQPALNDVSFKWLYPADNEAEPPVAVQTPSVFPPILTGTRFVAYCKWLFRADNEAEPPVVIQTPSVLPPILTGTRFVAYCMWPPGAVLPESLEVSATTATESINMQLSISSREILRGDLLHKLAARSRIADLEASPIQLYVGFRCCWSCLWS